MLPAIAIIISSRNVTLPILDITVTALLTDHRDCRAEQSRLEDCKP